MKSPMRGSLIWYVLGVLLASIPWPFYLAVTDPRPVFINLGSSPPDFWTHFWDYFPDYAFSSFLIFGLIIILTTPIYFIFRLCFRFRGLPPKINFTSAWLAGALNCCLVFFVLTTTGQAVKGPPGFMDRFMDSGGIFALPFITTMISFLPGLLFRPFFRKGANPELRANL